MVKHGFFFFHSLKLKRYETSTSLSSHITSYVWTYYTKYLQALNSDDNASANWDSFSVGGVGKRSSTKCEMMHKYVLLEPLKQKCTQTKHIPESCKRLSSKAGTLSYIDL